MTEPARRPVHQERSRITRRKILDAARAALIASGWEGLAISRVASAAGTSVGSIYQHFGDKNGLAHAVQHDVLDAVDADLRSRFARLVGEEPASASRLLEEAIDLLASQVGRHGAAMGQLLLRAASDPTLHDRGQATGALAEDLFVGLVDTHADLFDPPPSDTATRVAFRAVFGAAMWRLMFGDINGGTPIADHALVREWTAMCQAYLISGVSSGPTERQR